MQEVMIVLLVNVMTNVVLEYLLYILWLCRYELPQPSAGRMNDVAAWQECVDNSSAQLEHQALRSVLPVCFVVKYY